MKCCAQTNIEATRIFLSHRSRRQWSAICLMNLDPLIYQHTQFFIDFSFIFSVNTAHGQTGHSPNKTLIFFRPFHDSQILITLFHHQSAR